MIRLLLLCSVFGRISTSETSQLSTNYQPRFEYEFKVLQRLAMLEIEQKQLKDKLYQNTAKVDEQMMHLQSIQKDLDNNGHRVEYLEKNPKHEASGSAYIRWGRKTCPGNGTDMIYSGYAAGGYSPGHSGAASNLLCLTNQPTVNGNSETNQGYSTIYGTEYEESRSNLQTVFGKDLFYQDVPCAHCRSTRSVSVLIPGRDRCYDGWTMEYNGFIMSDADNSKGASEYICVDGDAMGLQGGQHSPDAGRRLYITRVKCGALKCPPYVKDFNIACVVCTR